MPPKPRPSEAVAKPPTVLASTVVIAETASLTGTFPIKIGANTVIHPRAKLTSAHGPITIGEHCIICERTQICPPDAEGLIIGDGVVVEVNAVVEGSVVGAGSVVEVGVKIGKGGKVGLNCKLGPLTKVLEGEVVEDNTVIFGSGQRRIDASGTADARRRLLERHIESLRVLIPSNPSKFIN
ncbi:trimeric LpxA-like protein [Tuber indicum]|nr:trimeric LpxA-like protein [Tuber indicum]